MNRVGDVRGRKGQRRRGDYVPGVEVEHVDLVLVSNDQCRSEPGVDGDRRVALFPDRARASRECLRGKAPRASLPNRARSGARRDSIRTRVFAVCSLLGFDNLR